MSDVTQALPGAHAPSRLRWENRKAYATLMRFGLLDPPLVALAGFAVGFTEAPVSMGSLGRCVLLLLLGVVLFWIVHVMDDLTGLASGTDIISAPQKERIGEPKVLVSGVVQMREARSLLMVLVLLAGLLLVPVLWYAPPITVVLILSAGFITGQYSVGARWSYRSLGEFMVALNFACCFLVPYTFVTAHVSSRALLLSLLFGLCIVQVTFSSNYADLHADASSGRLSVMARFGIVATKRTVVAIGVAFWFVFAAVLWQHALPQTGLMLLVLAPLQWQALRHFIADAPLDARRGYFRMNRLLAVLVLSAIVLDRLVVRFVEGVTR